MDDVDLETWSSPALAPHGPTQIGNPSTDLCGVLFCTNVGAGITETRLIYR